MLNIALKLNNYNMKRIFTLLIMITLGFGAQAQVYVNAAASGSNNGTSWANAYTDLQAALSSTATGNIWIAKGTYKAAGAAGDTTVFFRMNTAKNLYGGFAGTETTLAARNVTANATIISADTKGDDKVDSLTLNKVDNRRHCLVLDTSITTGTVILDGLIFENGYSRSSIINDTTRLGWREYMGGGVLSFCNTTINNCIFRGNYARNGGAFAFLGDSVATLSITITNSDFTKNNNSLNGALGMGAYIARASKVSIDKTTFDQNSGLRAGLFLDGVVDGSVSNTTFSKNVATSTSPGVGFYAIRNRSISLKKCEFIENESALATSGVGAYFDISAVPSISSDITALNEIDNCIFRENKTLSNGAALRLVGGSNVKITNNTFIANVNGASWGSVYIIGEESVLGRMANVLVQNNKFYDNSTVTTSTSAPGAGLVFFNTSAIVNNCDFNNNTGVRGPHLSFNGNIAHHILVSDCSFTAGKASGIGGCTYSQMTVGTVTFRNCKFEGNSSSGNGGVMYHGFGSITNVEDCEFTTNTGAGSGAIRIANPITTMTVKRSRFVSNSAIGGSFDDGGAIYASAEAALNIDSCEFLLNSANRLGGAIGLGSDKTFADIRNSSFVSNSSPGSGGAIYTFEGEMTVRLTNCKFEANTSGGSGGAILLRTPMARNLPSGQFFVDRCSFIANEALTQGGAIDFQRRSALIQNSIFSLNKVTGSGVGGAIIYNADDTIHTRIARVINNTFDSNEGNFIPGLAMWGSANPKNLAFMEFQNNIFNEVNGVGIEDNKPTLTSKGGNLMINDESKAHTIATDILDAGFKFGDLEWNLAAGSKAINAGIAAGAPTYDFNNKLRVGIPDIGAIEFGATVSGIYENLFTAVSVFPNPTASLLTIQDDQYVKAGDAYTVFDINARILKSGRITDNKSIDVSSLNAGEYFLRVYGEKITQAKFLVVR